jgi:hypothetical protein
MPADVEFALVAAVNDDEILASCLAASPDVVAGRLTVTAIRGAHNMAEAYNGGLAQVRIKLREQKRDAPLIVLFAHQDVYLPAGWLDLAEERLAALTKAEPDWMVAGPYGVRADGSHVGLVWDGGLERELGVRGFGHAPVVSLDELLLIVRDEDGFGFDPHLPGFHLYGTDLVQGALKAGRGAFAVELPLVHNSQRVDTLSGGYTRAYRYARDKWRARLPIPTTICDLSVNPLHLLRAKWRVRKVARRTGKPTLDAAELTRLAGYASGAGGSSPD